MAQVGIAMLVVVGSLAATFIVIVMQVLKEQFAEVRTTLTQQARDINRLDARIADRAAEITDVMHRIGRAEDRVKTLEDETDPIEFTEIEKNLKEMTDRLAVLEECHLGPSETTELWNKHATRVASLDVRVARLETMNDKVVQALAPQNQPRVEWPKRELPRELPPQADPPKAEFERKCGTTHHHACDCRERMMKQLAEVSTLLAGEVELAMTLGLTDTTNRRANMIKEVKDLVRGLGY